MWQIKVCLRHWVLSILGSYFCVPSYLSVSISSIVAWILAEVPDGQNVGFDPFLFSVGMFFS